MSFLINPYIYGIPDYLVDQYSPLVAFGLNKLSSTATNCIRVRRSSDSSEQDIGFSGDDLDTSALTTFVGANDGLVVKWYNQGTGGSTYDASQVTAASQQHIVSSGSVTTLNSVAALDGTISTYKPMLNLGSTATGIKTVFTVGAYAVINTVNYMVAGASKGVFYGGSLGSVTDIGAFDGSNVRNYSGTEDTNQHLGYFNMRSSNIYIAKDGSAEYNAGSFAASQDYTGVASYSASSSYLRGQTQAVIMFTTDESSNKSAIETYLNDYYGVY